MSVLSWLHYSLQLIARILSLLLCLALIFAGGSKQITMSSFMEDFYDNVLAPKYQELILIVGAESVVKLNGVLLRNIFSALELLAGLLLLLNYRRIGALLVLVILAGGSKNVGARTISLVHFGDFEIYPVAFIQAVVAILIFILPGGSRSPTKVAKESLEKKLK